LERLFEINNSESKFAIQRFSENYAIHRLECFNTATLSSMLSSFLVKDGMESKLL